MKNLLLAAAFAAASTLSATATAQDGPTKVGFIYVGPIGDLGWTYRHDIGRKAIEEEFGDKVETTYIENVPEGAEAVKAITQLAETGHDLIFTTSFGFMDPTNEVAKQYPDVKFEHATGYKRESENVSTFSARFYEGRVVQGLIAAKMTKTNKIGYIASFPIPEVVRGINAFQMELAKHNPDAKVDVKWVFTWFDPAKEAEAAQAFIDAGADIIIQHTDSPAAMTIAEKTEGVYAFGQASDMSRFGATSHLMSIVDNWDSYYIDRVRAVMDDSWSQTDTWWGLSKDGQGNGVGMVELGSYSNISDELMAEAKALEESLRSGARHSFPCPVYKQDGELAKDCADGKDHLQDFPTLVSMDWYIQGIEGSLPK
jgi:simple sugar transport system substrate-binding protein